MLVFSVKYKKKGQWFWRTLIGIKGDARQNFLGADHIMFIRADESSVLVPVAGTEFQFSRERHELILKQMEKDAKQKLPVE